MWSYKLRTSNNKQYLVFTYSVSCGTKTLLATVPGIISISSSTRTWGMADVASRWIRRFSPKNVFKLVQAPVIEPRAKLLSRRRPRSSKKLMCITSWLNFFTFICGRSSLLRFVQTMLKICCNRQFSFCREIGNFLSLHWCSQLYQTQTAASSLNRPTPCSLTTTARLNLPLFFFFFFFFLFF